VDSGSGRFERVFVDSRAVVDETPLVGRLGGRRKGGGRGGFVMLACLARRERAETK
jgi:hypothetical protein